MVVYQSFYLTRIAIGCASETGYLSPKRRPLLHIVMSDVRRIVVTWWTCLYLWGLESDSPFCDASSDYLSPSSFCAWRPHRNSGGFAFLCFFNHSPQCFVTLASFCCVSCQFKVVAPLVEVVHVSQKLFHVPEMPCTSQSCCHPMTIFGVGVEEQLDATLNRYFSCTCTKLAATLHNLLLFCGDVDHYFQPQVTCGSLTLSVTPLLHLSRASE